MGISVSGFSSDLSNNRFNQSIQAGEDFLSKFLQGGVKLESKWESGFVGINAHNKELVKTAVTKLIKDVEAVTAGFAASTYIPEALKGEASDACWEYINGVKALLNAYVSSYNAFIDLLDKTFSEMNQGDKSNASSIRTAADELKERAKAITIE